MLSIRTILHPTDFSEYSMNACRLACALARDYGARLIILHVAHETSIIYGEMIVPPDADLHLEQARDRLLQLDVPDAGISVQRQIEDGDPVIEILRVTDEIQADLIVMGTHGRRGLKRILMGSVAEGVMRKARCPVLTVRTPFAEESPIQREAFVDAAG